MNKRRRVYGQACTFCSKRKIKCSGSYPCDKCVERNQGALCAAQHPRSATHFPGHNGQSQEQSGISAATAGTPNVQPSTSASDVDVAIDCLPTQLGENSICSFVDAAAQSRNTGSFHAIRPALGLENTSRSYPFMSTNPAVESGDGTISLPFSHAEVLKYSQVYQTMVAPLFPFVPQEGNLESLILACLEQSARYGTTGSATNVTNIQLEHGRTSLMCAILACGAQMSDQAPDERVAKSRGFARSAFHFARMANFMHASIDCIQSILVLSFFLQNDGQADAAWSLIGTSSRLAMTMGLHKPSLRESTGKSDRDNHLVWAVIGWQDCILSVCFDRNALPPSYARITMEVDCFAVKPRTYQECIEGLLETSCRWLAEPEASRGSADRICSHLGRLDTFDADDLAITQARSVRPDRKALIELLTIKLYCGYLRTVICRPALKTWVGPHPVAPTDKIFHAAKSSTMSTMQAFIDLCTFTQIPLRTWSMIHAALSAAITVEFVETGHGLSPLRQVQTTFLNLLSSESLKSQPGSGYQAWLSFSHSGYLYALQDILKRREGGGTPETEAVNNNFEGMQFGISRDDVHINDEIYAQARRNIANAVESGQGAYDLSDFDWSLNFLHEQQPFLGTDFTDPFSGF